MDQIELAKKWVFESSDLSADYYCSNSAVFQSRLVRLQEELSGASDEKLKNIFPLIVAVAGEIGNNSFDHNLGNWPDISGILFAYDLSQRQIVLADRGQGILCTLKRSKPSLTNDQEALIAAFTETISGRAPENRGNGLKFVREVIIKNQMQLSFQTGNANLELGYGERDLTIKKVEPVFRGCLAVIKF